MSLIMLRSPARTACRRFLPMRYSLSTLTGPSLPHLPEPDYVKYKGTEKAQQSNIFTRAWQRLSIVKEQKRIMTAEQLFQAATVQSQDPRWYGPGLIGHDFRPRHAMLTTHVWFLHLRMINDLAGKNEALMVQEEFFRIFWDDTVNRIRHAGVRELLVSKEYEKEKKRTFSLFTNYDRIYTEFLDKPIERNEELRKLVRLHILQIMPNTDGESMAVDKSVHPLQAYDDYVDRIAWYIDANYQNIMWHWPEEYYKEARVAWVDLPSFANIKDNDGNIVQRQPQPVDQAEAIPRGWRRNVTMKGVYYYWNMETGKSTYERSDMY